MNNYIARDQYGTVIFFTTKYPRKYLMEWYGVKSAQKMYIGDGDHIGWIINGHWLHVEQLKPLNFKYLIPQH